jgi:5-methylthioadenosine/S-adenosylhomocysteine deaminase
MVSEDAGGVFSDREIVEMATINAARMLKWEAVLGSIEPGKRADLLVVDGQTGDAYARLIAARETSVALVVIDGVPRYGSRGLMARFTGPVESLRVGPSKRSLNLQQATADPVVGAISLSEATERLIDGLKRLPELATSRVANGARAATPSAVEGERWFLELDHAPFDGTLVRLKMPLGVGESAADAASRAAEDDTPLIPLDLDALTIVDDRHFAQTISNQPNLPERIRQELPGLYGK